MFEQILQKCFIRVILIFELGILTICILFIIIAYQVKSLIIQIHVACITKVLYTLYIKKERLLIYTFEKRLIVS
jgi:hypothetical protein